MPVCRNRWIVQHYLISWIGEQADYCRQRHFGWGRDGVRRGRPGLAGSAPSGLVAVGVPAANSLSRIFVRVGNGLNGPTFTIPDSMPGSLDCAARELQSPGYSVDTVTNATMPQALNRLRNSSTTVMRRMLASIKSVEEVLGGGLLLLRHYHAKNRDSGMVVCKLLILRGKNNFFWCDRLPSEVQVGSLGRRSYSFQTFCRLDLNMKRSLDPLRLI